MRAKGSTLVCAKCDESVPEGSASCPWQTRGSAGSGRNGVPCASRAFYRVGARPMRHIMGAPLSDDEPEATAPYHARRTAHGHKARA